MRLGSDLQEFVKMKRELENLLQSNQIYIDSNTRQMARALHQYSEEQKRVARLLQEDVSPQMQAIAQLAEVSNEYATTAQFVQNQLYSPEVIRAVQDIATLQKQIESQLVSNQAFVDAVSQYQELAETVQALHRRGVSQPIPSPLLRTPNWGPKIRTHLRLPSTIKQLTHTNPSGMTFTRSSRSLLSTCSQRP